jgi:hypothetical protein
MKNLLKNIVGAVAPTLGTALGGPMGGMAANMIADVLGCPNNPKAIEKAVAEATPEQMLELKKVEKDFDWTARIMGIATVGGFLGYIFLVTLQPPEQNSEALINLVLGYLGGLASAVISFYFGASNSSDK